MPAVRAGTWLLVPRPQPDVVVRLVLPEDPLGEEGLLVGEVNAQQAGAHLLPAELHRLLEGSQLAGEEAEAAFILVGRPVAAGR